MTTDINTKEPVREPEQTRRNYVPRKEEHAILVVFSTCYIPRKPATICPQHFGDGLWNRYVITVNVITTKPMVFPSKKYSYNSLTSVTRLHILSIEIRVCIELFQVDQQQLHFSRVLQIQKATVCDDNCGILMTVIYKYMSHAVAKYVRYIFILKSYSYFVSFISL